MHAPDWERGGDFNTPAGFAEDIIESIKSGYVDRSYLDALGYGTDLVDDGRGADVEREGIEIGTIDINAPHQVFLEDKYSGNHLVLRKKFDPELVTKILQANIERAESEVKETNKSQEPLVSDQQTQSIENLNDLLK